MPIRPSEGVWLPPTALVEALVLLLVLLALSLAVAQRTEGFVHPNARITPPGLYGVVLQGDLGEADYQWMRTGGVSSLRVFVDRASVEPEPGVREWTYLDRLVGEASRHEIELLPFVYGSPDWVAANHATPPIHSRADRVAWRSFLRALATRYGPRGSFWAGRSDRLPIRTWQVWNEPNLSIYWKPFPEPSEYARLVRISAAAIRGADPRAEIMLAGLAPTRVGIPTEQFLTGLYDERGIRGEFDIVALHPYATRIEALRVQIDRVRGIIDVAGDRRTPLAITELGWASQQDPAMLPASPRHALVKGPWGQARMLRRSFALLWRKRQAWSLERVEWYAWKDATGAVEPICDFCRFAGLFSAEGDPKPAWEAFRGLARRSRHFEEVDR